MAAAILVTLDKEIPDAQATYAKGKTGKALAREADRLNLAARTVKVPAVSNMLSENQDALIAQMKADGFDPSKMRIPPEQWFTAAEGLISVRKLIDHVTANLNNFKQPNPILRDLKAVEALLVAAEQQGVRFHFSNGVL